MPAKKKSKSQNKKKSTNKKPSKTVTSVKKTAEPKSDKPAGVPSTRPVNQVLPFIFGLLSAFILFCFIWPNASGAVGEAICSAVFGIFGVASVAVPVLLLLLAIGWLKIIDSNKIYFKLLYGTLFLSFFSAFCAVFKLEAENRSASALYELGGKFSGGGLLGGALAQLMKSAFGTVFTGIIAAVLTIVFACLTVGITPVTVIAFIKRKVKASASKVKKKEPVTAKVQVVEEDEDGEDEDDGIFADSGYGNLLPPVDPEPEKTVKRKKELYDYEKDNIIPNPEPDELSKLLDDDEGVEQFVRKPAEIFLADGILVQKPDKVPAEKSVTPEEPDETPVIETVKTPVTPQQNHPEPAKEIKKKPAPEYKFPPLKLLSLPDGKGAGISSDEAISNAKKIVDTLSNFGISVSVENISRGPTITRYELKPAPGVRIARIGNLIDDLARVLASGGVRFESSIEGKDTVGIEVPNKTPFTVNIRTLLDTDTFRNAKSKVFCALGVSVSNDPTFLDIQKMPHMIIAGATGMGKSVCINSLIVSILYRAKPDEVKLIMIDPKKVEFAPYAGIPHLLVPVITDMKKAAGSLNWLVQEMERRYDLIEAAGCRNIFSYNDMAKEDPSMEKLPVLVIIIDELADLMSTSKDNVESSIARIAAKARAAGMHLIIGTQRPDVTVISGTIKNNIPSRIACRVGSQIDSRTILDEGGAERLIGRGDMLYKPVGALKLTRLQGAFVSESEVEAVVGYIKNQGIEADYSDEAIKNIDKAAESIPDGKKKLSISGAESGDDELLLAAIEISFDAGKVATSLLNRKLSIGYGRAAKIIDRMEEMGICSGANGSKPRDLIMSREQFIAKYGQSDDE